MSKVLTGLYVNVLICIDSCVYWTYRRTSDERLPWWETTPLLPPLSETFPFVLSCRWTPGRWSPLFVNPVSWFWRERILCNICTVMICFDLILKLRVFLSVSLVPLVSCNVLSHLSSKCRLEKCFSHEIVVKNFFFLNPQASVALRHREVTLWYTGVAFWGSMASSALIHLHQ